GSLTNARWSVGANWSGGTAPTGNDDDLIFPASPAQLTSTNDLVSAVFNSITISGSNYLLNGSPLTLGTPTSSGNSSGFVSVGANVTNDTIALNMVLASQLGAEQLFTVNSASILTV